MARASLLPALILMLLAAGASPATFKVSKNGPFPTIQEALNAAGPDDTVSVAAGVYEEALVILGGRDGLRLIGKGKVIIDPRPNGEQGSGPGIQVFSQDVTIQGVTIRHARQLSGGMLLGGTSQGYGVWSQASGTSIIKCEFVRCEDGAITIQADGARIDNCTIRESFDHGIEIAGDNAVVTRTEIRGTAGIGLTIGGLSPEVSRCTIGPGSDVGMQVSGSGARITRNKVMRTDGGGLEGSGDQMVIDRNTFEYNCDEAITYDGDDVSITGNTITFANGGGACGSGDDLVFSKNRISDVTGEALEHSGEDARIEKNTLSDVGGTGLFILEADDARIVSNRIENVTEGAIIVEGLDLLIERNTIESCLGNGIDVAGDGAQILRNTLKQVWCGGNGIRLRVSESSEILDNRLEDIAATGIEFVSNTEGCQVLRNRVARAGVEGGRGIEVQGSAHLVQDNQVQDGIGDGIALLGSLHMIDDNTVKGCTSDGIKIVSGTDHSVTNNVVTGNEAEGIENGAMDTIIDDNRSTGNRTDFASSNSIASFEGNVSGDGSGPKTEPEID